MPSRYSSGSAPSGANTTPPEQLQAIRPRSERLAIAVACASMDAKGRIRGRCQRSAVAQPLPPAQRRSSASDGRAHPCLAWRRPPDEAGPEILTVSSSCRPFRASSLGYKGPT
jgi:hypothetical protein